MSTILDIMSESVAFRGLSDKQYTYFSRKLEQSKRKDELIQRLEDLNRNKSGIIDELIQRLEDLNRNKSGIIDNLIRKFESTIK